MPQTPLRQRFGGVQSLLDMQAVLHAVESLLHLNVLHEREPPPMLQLPLPLHVLANVPLEVPDGHDCGAHCVLVEYLLHAPAPSHLPLLPQVEVAEMPH